MTQNRAVHAFVPDRRLPIRQQYSAVVDHGTTRHDMRWNGTAQPRVHIFIHPSVSKPVTDKRDSQLEVRAATTLLDKVLVSQVNNERIV